MRAPEELDDDFILDETDDDTPVKQAFSGVPYDGEGSDEAQWSRLNLDDKCSHVMALLAEGQRRWTRDHGDPNIPVLEEYKVADLTQRDMRDVQNPTALHILAKHWGKHVDKVPTETLHRVISYLLENRDEGSQKPPILIRAMAFDNDKFIDCIMSCWCTGFADLLDIQDDEGQNSLHYIFSWAMATRNYPTPQGRKVPATAIKEKVLERAKKIVSHAHAKTLVAKDIHGNTPIHYAVDYRQCYWRGPDYVEIVKDMILKANHVMTPDGAFNRNDLSPIMYCRRTKQHYEQRQAAKRQAQDRAKIAGQRAEKEPPFPMVSRSRTGSFEPDVNKKVPEGILRNRPQTLSRGDSERHLKGDALASSGLGRTTTLQKDAIPGTGKESKIWSPFDPDSKMPPPKAPAESGKGNAGSLDNQAKEKSVHELLEFLTLNYLRTRPDIEARELIEGKDTAQNTLYFTNLYFDASGHKEAKDVVELVKRMSIGGFGSVLSHVRIPTINHADQRTVKTREKSYSMNVGVSRHSRGQDTENLKIGRSSVVGVLDKLYEAGVRHILRLHVEDRQSPSHTDEAIERALRGRASIGDDQRIVDSKTSDQKTRGAIQVEVWDWRKPDLSTDVIAYAAPTVEVVNLYWSGNQTVLRGWSCAEGIPRLYTTTKQRLKTINLFPIGGLEARYRLNEMLERFKRDITMRTAGRVEVKLQPMTLSIDDLDVGTEESDSMHIKEEGERQHDWVNRMDDFRLALRGVHDLFREKKLKETDRVKVALIDDGVDLGNLTMYNDTVRVTGVSYCPSEGRAETPWYRSSGGHGTVMANMILRINPWALLYSMKLKVGRANDAIYAESAARAIQGAIRQKVDIISMSWSVKHKIAEARLAGEEAGANKPDGPVSPEMAALDMLDQAVKEAQTKGILMFCSATDDIQASSDDSLPYRAGKDYIFRIGAASAHGQHDPRVEDQKRVDYYFPGNQVAEAMDPRSAGTVKYHDGSSVGTALAAGLASLIIYCAALMETWSGHKKAIFDTKMYGTFVTLLKERDKMKRAFDNIESDSWGDKKYLPVWTFFGAAADEMGKAAMGKVTGLTEQEKDYRVGVLDRLVEDLCSKIQRA